MLTKGFRFGEDILAVCNDTLNNNNAGYCCTGKSDYYDIEGEVSPLTG